MANGKLHAVVAFRTMSGMPAVLQRHTLDPREAEDLGWWLAARIVTRAYREIPDILDDDMAGAPYGAIAKDLDRRVQPLVDGSKLAVEIEGHGIVAVAVSRDPVAAERAAIRECLSQPGRSMALAMAKSAWRVRLGTARVESGLIDRQRRWVGF